MICPYQKCLKSLMQGVFALVCDVMAGWPPPQPIQKLHMVLEQLCIIDLTLNKNQLNQGHAKHSANQAFAYYHKTTTLGA